MLKFSQIAPDFLKSSPENAPFKTKYIFLTTVDHSHFGGMLRISHRQIFTSCGPIHSGFRPSSIQCCCEHANIFRKYWIFRKYNGKSWFGGFPAKSDTCENYCMCLGKYTWLQIARLLYFALVFFKTLLTIYELLSQTNYINIWFAEDSSWFSANT